MRKERKKILVSGPSGITDIALVQSCIREALNSFNFHPSSFVCSEEKGVNACARQLAQDRGIHVEEFRENAARDKEKAWKRRNWKMVDFADCLICINPETCKNTFHTLHAAKKINLFIYIFDLKNNIYEKILPRTEDPDQLKFSLF